MARSIMVMHLLVAQVDAGSNPVESPNVMDP